MPSTAFADAWTKVDLTENPQFFIDLLDATRVELLDRARKDPQRFFAAHELAPGLRVLDVGSGTGDLLRLISQLVSPGRCLGVDISETMVAEAQRRALGLSGVAFQVGDAHRLELEDESFDRITATQVLVHVPEPARALSECYRLLAPGGRLVIAEVDWPGIVIECGDRDLGRRFTTLASEGLRNGHIVRELRWRLQEAGFVDVHHSPEVSIAHAAGAFQKWFIEPALRHFIGIGAFTESEATRFVEDLDQRSQAGRYFFARTYYTIVASRRA